MNNQKEVLEVSDWSQKYKLAVYAVAILGTAAFVYFIVMPWMNEVVGLLERIANK